MKSNPEKVFLELFIIALLIVWSPFKLLAYVLPFGLITYYIIRTNSGVTLIRFTVVVLLFIIVSLFWYLQSLIIGEDYILQNNIIAFITYGSFVFLIVMAHVKIYNYTPYLHLISTFLILESLLGLGQVFIFVLTQGGNFDGASGDVVQGTINIASFLNPGINFNNPMFSVNIAILLLFYVPYMLTKSKKYSVFLVSILALFFASVLHIIIILLVSISIVIFIFYFNYFSKKFLYGIAAVFFLFSFLFPLLYYIQPNNFTLIEDYYEKITKFQNPKAVITYKVFTEMPTESPLIFTGLGLGQFTSRASLIGTGRYFGDFLNPSPVLPIFENQMSDQFREKVYPLWYDYETNVSTYGGSSISKPYYSILSLITELGFILFLCLLLLLLRFILQLRSYFLNIQNPILKRYYAMSIAILTLFIFLISLIENYLEVTQAIFIGIFLGIVFNPLRKDNNENSPNT